jgi:hypothetical protein
MINFILFIFASYGLISFIVDTTLIVSVMIKKANPQRFYELEFKKDRLHGENNLLEI